MRVSADYALRCMTAAGAVHKAAGAVLATCCHHRCERAPYVASRQLRVGAHLTTVLVLHHRLYHVFYYNLNLYHYNDSSAAISF